MARCSVAILQARQAQQIVDDRVEPLGLLGNNVHVAPGLLGIGQPPFLKGLGEALNGRYGRLELMRDIRDEIAAKVLKPVDLSHIAQYDHRAGPLPLGSDRPAPHT